MRKQRIHNNENDGKLHLRALHAIESRKRKKGKLPVIFIMLFVTLFLAFTIAACSGHYSLNPIACIKMLILKPFKVNDGWSELDENVFFEIRLPRIVAAIIIGACLSISGGSYQSVFQNPLVSPDILGVSSGACVGAAVGIMLHLPQLLIILSAFISGILTVTLTMLIPKLLKSNSNIMLVLSGIIIGGLTTSIMGIIKYVADPLDELPRITYWTMGSLANIDFSVILIALIPIVICMIILVRMSWWIDVISMGEKDAKTLGANVNRIRLIIIICSTLLTALAVSMCGTIGWIGLVIPHFARLFVGPSNTKLIPAAAILGAIFLLIVDTLARTIVTIEVPLSIITGFIGAPCYAWFLYRQRTKLN